MDGNASRLPIFPWVKTIVVAIAWIGGIALLLAFGRTTSPQDATAEMEQLALRAERAQAIHPVTAQEIERLIGQSAYDCQRVDCSPELAARNSLARAHLQIILAEKTDPGFMTAAGPARNITEASSASR